MQDIRLQTDFLTHPKLAKLRRRLGADAVLSLMHLWCWVANNRPKGDLGGMDEEDIEIASDWRLKPGELTSALVELRLLDKTKNGYSVHDWEENQPWAFHSPERTARARNAVNQRWNKRLGVQPSDSIENSAILNDTRSNTPSPAPSPSPVPIPSPSPTPISSENFERVWMTGNKLGSKQMALKLVRYWVTTRGKSVQDLTDAITHYVNHCDGTGQYQMHIPTFFNRAGEHWPEWVNGCPSCAGPCLPRQQSDKKFESQAEKLTRFIYKERKQDGEKTEAGLRIIDGDSLLLPGKQGQAE